MIDKDSYYQVLDVHGDKFECSQCECEIDSSYISHWGHVMGTNGVEEAVPLCDRCWYDECARDAERGEVDGFWEE